MKNYIQTNSQQLIANNTNTMNLTINIPYLPSFVNVEKVKRVFEDEFGNIDVTIDIIIKKNNNNDMEYQLLFVHLVSKEPNEKLLEYSKAIEVQEVWFWYSPKHYFKTRKLLNKPRMISNTDMEEIKKGLNSVKLDSGKAESVCDSDTGNSDAESVEADK